MNSNKTTLAASLLAIALLASAIGAGAYTMFTAERSAQLDVVTDDTGILILDPGSSGLVYQQSNGELTIDTDNTSLGMTGVNVNSTLYIGNTSDPTNEFGFGIENNDANAHNVTLNYSVANDVDTNGNVIYHVYDGTGTEIATASEEADATFQASANTKYYVVVEVDTIGGDAGTDDLSGTLKITAK